MARRRDQRQEDTGAEEAVKIDDITDDAARSTARIIMEARWSRADILRLKRNQLVVVTSDDTVDSSLFFDSNEAYDEGWLMKTTEQNELYGFNTKPTPAQATPNPTPAATEINLDASADHGRNASTYGKQQYRSSSDSPYT
ncbi:hypothetical protein GN244_ATG18592 [Phytophthora infestans]|uniref:Uncharacterized protein n=1 Tax=Phytophthora infestans TaxID=4787 RepID=A0A833W5S1_PHYIN|nr:hypothetical protein GN244_ATG18592 [Phytophthora infestans]